MIKDHRQFSSQYVGSHYEQMALTFLCQQGLHLRATNFRSKLGEIDLIMKDAGVLVFIEVRYRKTKDFGGAVHSVTKAKQRKLRRCAALFLQLHYGHSRPKQQHLPDCRFDVIAITATGSGVPEINWIKAAF